MSFRSSFAVLALALAALQGCAAPMVAGSSTTEPHIASISVPGPGASRADEPMRSTTLQPIERVAPERHSPRSIEHRGFRSESCRRSCAN